MKLIRIWLAAGLAVCVALVAAAWLLLISPVRKNVAATKAATVQLESQDTSLQAQLDQLRSEQSQVPAKLAALSTVAKAIPSTPELPDLIRLLKTIATDTHIAVSAITPTAPAAAGTTPGAAAAPAGVETIALSIAAAGTYPDMEEFLNRLETSDRLFTVKTLTLAPAGKAIGLQAVPLSITISAAVYVTTTAITTPPVLNLPGIAVPTATAAPAAATGQSS